VQNAGECIPLSRQVEYFRATRAKMVAAVGSRAADARISNSIFLISAGTNDLFVSPAAQQQRDAAAALVAGLISNYSAIITVYGTHQLISLHAPFLSKFL
jgi:hypothetical protein